MARPAERFISELNEHDRLELERIRSSGDSRRERDRAHAVILSSQGVEVSQIARIFGVIKQTAYAWLDRWDNGDSLKDQQRPGAPRKLNDEAEQLLLDQLAKKPHHPKNAIDCVETAFDIRISNDTLRRIAKRQSLAWKRLRGSLSDRRDQVAFDKGKADIRTFLDKQDNEELHVWFFDEASFSLTPSIPYGWQPIGETIEIPFQRGNTLSALGFIDIECNFHPYEFTGSVNSEVAISVFDHFANSVDGDNVVILDNAPVHRSNLFRNQIPRWEEQGVKLYFLPPYSPELNLIEIVWRNIKHHWLPLKAYRSALSLWDHLGDVMSKIGSQFAIDFPSLEFT